MLKKKDPCHQHKVEGHNSQSAPNHLRRVRATVVLKWILGVLRNL